jgi:hypothetical protein
LEFPEADFPWPIQVSRACVGDCAAKERDRSSAVDKSALQPLLDLIVQRLKLQLTALAASFGHPPYEGTLSEHLLKLAPSCKHQMSFFFS